MADSSRWRWRRWRLVAGYVVAILLVGWMAARGLWSDQSLKAIRQVPLTAVFASLVLFLVHLILNSYAYALTLIDMGGNLPVRRTALIYLATVLGKYLPGGAGQVVGRWAVLRTTGLPHSSILWSLAIEQGMSLWVVACFVAALWLSSHAWVSGTHVVTGPLVAMLLLLITWWLYRWFVQWTQRCSKAHDSGGLFVIVTFISITLFGCAYAVLLWNPSTSTNGVTQGLLSVFLGTFTGIISVISPGGLGVREVVAAELIVESQAALGLLLLARALIFLTEVVCTLVSFLLRGRW